MTLQELRKTRYEELAKSHKFAQDIVGQNAGSHELEGDDLSNFKNAMDAFDVLDRELAGIDRMIRAEAEEKALMADMDAEKGKANAPKMDLDAEFLKLENAYAQGRKGIIHTPTPTVGKAEGKVLNTVQYTDEGKPDWKFAYGVGGKEEYANLQLQPAVGGQPNIVSALPRTMTSLVQAVIDQSPILQRARVFQTPNGHTIRIPLVDEHGDADAHREGAAISESDISFKTPLQLDYYEAGRLLTNVSKTFLRDFPEGRGLITTALAESLGRFLNNWYLNGTGVAGAAGQPEGLLIGANHVANNLRGVLASKTAITYEELVKIVTTPKAAYTNRPSCVMYGSIRFMEQLMLIRDNDQRPLFTLNMQDSAPYRIFGFPFVRDDTLAGEFAASSATGTTVGIFGPLDELWVRMVGGMEFASSDDYQFNQGTMAYRILQTTDSIVVREDALVKITLP